jgi:flagellin-like hook-associated protein FlgL
MKSEVSSLNTVANSINNAKSVLDVAFSAAEMISDLLIEMKEKAITLKAETDAGNKQSIVDDYNALFNQLNTAVGNASFNEKNVLEAGNFSALLRADGASLTINHEPMDTTRANPYQHKYNISEQQNFIGYFRC